METQRCLYCGGDATEADHAQRCDGRQGAREAFDSEPPPRAHFDGETYEPARDHERLHAQLSRVLTVMRDAQWHTLHDIAEHADAPEASVSARLRDLRKPKFGGYHVERRYVDRGLFEYRLLVAEVPDEQVPHLSAHR